MPIEVATHFTDSRHTAENRDVTAKKGNTTKSVTLEAEQNAGCDVVTPVTASQGEEKQAIDKGARDGCDLGDRGRVGETHKKAQSPIVKKVTGLEV